jgi:hypothetical protein
MANRDVPGNLGSMIIMIFLIITLTTTLTYSAVTFNGVTSATNTTSATGTSSTSTNSSSVTSHPHPPVLDGFSQTQYGGKSCGDTLTTSKPDDVLVMIVGQENAGPIVGVTDTAGLSWQHRASSAYNYTATQADTLDEWYAISASPLTGDNITATFANSGSIGCSVLGVTGANFASPFDPSVACPARTAVPQAAESSATTNSGTATICTSNPDDLLISSTWIRGGGDGATPANFTVIAGGGDLSFNEAYRQVSISQASLPLTWAFGGDSWAIIGDAITADGP